MVAMQLFYTALFSFLSQPWEVEYGVLTAKKVNLNIDFFAPISIYKSVDGYFKVSILHPTAQQFLHKIKALQILLYAVRIRKVFIEF